MNTLIETGDLGDSHEVNYCHLVITTRHLSLETRLLSHNKQQDESFSLECNSVHISNVQRCTYMYMLMWYWYVTDMCMLHTANIAIHTRPYQLDEYSSWISVPAGTPPAGKALFSSRHFHQHPHLGRCLYSALSYSSLGLLGSPTYWQEDPVQKEKNIPSVKSRRQWIMPSLQT